MCLSHTSLTENGVAENVYRYNGKELLKGVGLYDYGARYYDPAIARWGQVDALADHPNQSDKSVYAYAWNDPVKLTDPDGNCPWCGVIAAVVEYGTQVYSNYQDGSSGWDAWVNDVDFADVAIEGAVNFVPGGKGLKAAVTIVGTESVKSSVNVSVNDGVEHLGDGSENMTLQAVASDAAVNSVVSLAGAKANSSAENFASDGSLKQARADLTAARKREIKAENVAANGGPSAQRGYDGPTARQARADHRAAGANVQRRVTARSLGLDNVLIRSAYEETSTGGAGVFLRNDD